MDIFSGLSAVSDPAGLAALLVVLALVDSTSLGTLGVPVWLLLAPGRPRPGRVLVFLGTVAGAYFVIGLALMAGLGALLAGVDGLLDSSLARAAQLALGVVLFAVSFRFDGKRVARRRAAQEAAGVEPSPGRLQRWRARALAVPPAMPSAVPLAVPCADGEAVADAGGRGTVRVRTSVPWLVGLALAAVAVEVATMVPYLAGITAITSAGLTGPQRVAVLAGYCLVMVAPALLLLAGRLAAARVVEPILRRIDGWLTRNGEELVGWVLGIVGVLLALDAAQGLGFGA